MCDFSCNFRQYFERHFCHSCFTKFFHSFCFLFQSLSFCKTFSTNGFCFCKTFHTNSLCFFFSSIKNCFCFFLTSYQVSFCLLFSYKQVRFCLFFTLILFSVRFFTNFSSQDTLFNFCLLFCIQDFTLCTSNICVYIFYTKDFALFLFLNFIRIICDSLLHISLLFEFCLTNSYFIFLFSNSFFSIGLSIISLFRCFCSCNLYISFSLCFSNLSTLTNTFYIVNTKVINYITVIINVLNIKGYDFQTHFAQIFFSSFLYSLSKCLTIIYHLFQVHRTCNVTQRAFQYFSCGQDDFLFRLIQEMYTSLTQTFFIILNLYSSESIKFHINKFFSRNIVSSLYIYTQKTKVNQVKSFQERNFKTCFTNYNSWLFRKTTYHTCFISRNFKITIHKKQNTYCYNTQDYT